MAETWSCTICTLINEISKTVCDACGTARKVSVSDSESDGIEFLNSPFKKRKQELSPKPLPSSLDLEFLKDTLKPAQARQLSPDIDLTQKTPKIPVRKRKRTSPFSLSQLGIDSPFNDSCTDFESRVRKKAALASTPTNVVKDVRDIAAVKKVSKKSLSPEQVERALKKLNREENKTSKKSLSPKQVERALKKLKREEEKRAKALKRKKQQEERAQKRAQAAKEKAIQKVQKMYKAKNYMLHEIQIVFNQRVLDMNPEILPTLANKSSEWCPGANSKFHKHPFQYRVDNSIHERMITWEKFHFDPSLGQENPFDKSRRSRNFPGVPEPQTNPKEDPKPGAPRTYAVFYLKSNEVLNDAIMNSILVESLSFTDVLLLVTNYRFSGLPKKPCRIQEQLWTIWFDSENRIRHKMVRTDKEAAEFIGRHTRTLAEEQFKSKPTVISMAVAAKVTGIERGTRKTLTDSWILYLMQIDKISEDKARRIVNVYPTFSSLWNTYSRLSVEEGEKLLVDKLSNRHETTLSQRVYRWLYAPVTGNETV